ncbi:hypothetical protein U0E23_33085 [Burkholderia stagnalis]|uniref:hypothetical protein n=1 Tax=Burkholderia stagnalis TaxID=1503054 RepID=UPI002AB4AB74|nr:hypothetical protein [Burkholderia stagnalis]MDY7807271.1 hypothetical protein [Burkholderia stagnalis]
MAIKELRGQARTLNMEEIGYMYKQSTASISGNSNASYLKRWTLQHRFDELTEHQASLGRAINRLDEFGDTAFWHNAPLEGRDYLMAARWCAIRALADEPGAPQEIRSLSKSAHEFDWVRAANTIYSGDDRGLQQWLMAREQEYYFLLKSGCRNSNEIPLTDEGQINDGVAIAKHYYDSYIHSKDDEYSGTKLADLKSRQEMGYKSAPYFKQFSDYEDNHAHNEAKFQVSRITDNLLVHPADLRAGFVIERRLKVDVPTIVHGRRSTNSWSTALGDIYLIRMHSGQKLIVSTIGLRMRIMKSDVLFALLQGDNVSAMGDYVYRNFLAGGYVAEPKTLSGDPERNYKFKIIKNESEGATLRDFLNREQTWALKEASKLIKEELNDREWWEKYGTDLMPFSKVIERSRNDPAYTVRFEDVYFDAVDTTMTLATLGFGTLGLAGKTSTKASQAFLAGVAKGLKGLALKRFILMEVASLGKEAGVFFTRQIGGFLYPPVGWADMLQSGVRGAYRSMKTLRGPDSRDVGAALGHDNHSTEIGNISPDLEGRTGHQKARSEPAQPELEQISPKGDEPVTRNYRTDPTSIQNADTRARLAPAEPSVEVPPVQGAARATGFSPDALKRKIDGLYEINSILANPKEKCALATRRIFELMREEYPGIKIEVVQLLFWQSPLDAMPTNHYAVKYVINDQPYIVDVTIAQFNKIPGVRQGDVFIGTESDWLTKLKLAHRTSIIKMQTDATTAILNNQPITRAIATPGQLVSEASRYQQAGEPAKLLVNAKSDLTDRRWFSRSDALKNRLNSKPLGRRIGVWLENKQNGTKINAAGLHQPFVSKVIRSSAGGSELMNLLKKNELKLLAAKDTQAQIDDLRVISDKIDVALKGFASLATTPSRSDLGHIDSLLLLKIDVEVRISELQMNFVNGSGSYNEVADSGSQTRLVGSHLRSGESQIRAIDGYQSESRLEVPTSSQQEVDSIESGRIENSMQPHREDSSVVASEGAEGNMSSATDGALTYRSPPPAPQRVFEPIDVTWRKELNNVPTAIKWEVSDVIDLAQLKLKIDEYFTERGLVPPARDLTVRLVTMEDLLRELSADLNIPPEPYATYAGNLNAIPPAFTKSNGEILIAWNHPEYSYKTSKADASEPGEADVDKRRSTIIHEAIHSVSKDSKGFQNVVHRDEGKWLNGNFNIDEIVTDYIARDISTRMWQSDFVTGYTAKSGAGHSNYIWIGNLIKYLDENGYPVDDLIKAYLTNPDLLMSDSLKVDDQVRRAWNNFANQHPIHPRTGLPKPIAPLKLVNPRPSTSTTNELNNRGLTSPLKPAAPNPRRFSTEEDFDRAVLDYDTKLQEWREAGEDVRVIEERFYNQNLGEFKIFRKTQVVPDTPQAQPIDLNIGYVDAGDFRLISGVASDQAPTAAQTQDLVVTGHGYSVGDATETTHISADTQMNYPVPFGSIYAARGLKQITSSLSDFKYHTKINVGGVGGFEFSKWKKQSSVQSVPHTMQDSANDATGLDSADINQSGTNVRTQYFKRFEDDTTLEVAKAVRANRKHDSTPADILTVRPGVTGTVSDKELIAAIARLNEGRQVPYSRIHNLACRQVIFDDEAKLRDFLTRHLEMDPADVDLVAKHGMLDALQSYNPQGDNRAFKGLDTGRRDRTKRSAPRWRLSVITSTSIDVSGGGVKQPEIVLGFMAGERFVELKTRSAELIVMSSRDDEEGRRNGEDVEPRLEAEATRAESGEPGMSSLVDPER